MNTLLRTVLICAVLAPASAPRVAEAQGIDLSWGDCSFTGARAQVFDCSTNSGAPFALYGSFVPPSGFDSFTGFSADLDVLIDSPVPDWWHYAPGTCRAGSLAVGFDFTTNAVQTCFDAFGGAAAGGWTYDASPLSSVTTLHVRAALPEGGAVALDPTREYYAFRAEIGRALSNGPGACAGCSEPACIRLRTVTLYREGGAPVMLTDGYASFVYWQTSYSYLCEPDPVRPSTWGKVKTLYR